MKHFTVNFSDFIPDVLLELYSLSGSIGRIVGKLMILFASVLESYPIIMCHECCGLSVKQLGAAMFSVKQLSAALCSDKLCKVCSECLCNDGVCNSIMILLHDGIVI